MLNNKRTYYFLIACNLVVSLIGFYLGTKTAYYDSIGYWNMGKSFGYGTFSSWYFLPVSAPETLRTWGYPFFLFLCQQIADSPLVAQTIQLTLYLTSIFLILKLIKLFNSNLIYRNIFLLILIPNIKTSFYSGQISADSLCIFFMTLYAYLYYSLRNSVLKMILMAVCGFVLFQLKPVFLLFPVLLFLYQLIFQREKIKLYLFSTILYLLLLLPFGFWNYSNHGVFKVTPLEGGGGIMHIGYWCFKLPESYQEKFYWGLNCTADYTQPNFTASVEKSNNARLFETEWNDINNQLKPFADEEEQTIALMSANDSGQFILHTGTYTNEREKLLVGKTIEHIKEEPLFYLETRIYTFCRLWFTGINKNEWNDADSVTAKIKVLYPFLTSFVFIFWGLILIIAFVLLKKLSWSKFHFLFLLTIYFGLIHTPFAYQSRFTVPVHLFILLMFSFVITNFVFDKDTKNNGEHQNYALSEID